MSDEQGCETRDDALCALALGELAGEERAALIAHVERCRRCAAVLEHIARVTDGLLELAPDAEPPLGLEVRVLDAIGRQPQLRPLPRPRRRARLAIAAAILVIIGVGGGLIGHTFSPPSSVPVPQALAEFHSGGAAAGEAIAYPGRLIVSLDAVHYYGEVRCMVVTSDGTFLQVGSFWLAGSSDWWSVKLPMSTSAPKSAMLMSTGSHPHIVAEGSFSTAD